jgi:Icc-related predicted phosphoesterase
VEWVVVNGDLALEEFDLEEVVDTLAESGLPLLVVLGNSESKGSWARTYGDRIGKYPNLINGTWVRQIIADDVEFWTIAGYHDKRFVHQGAGCLYKSEQVDEMKKLTSGGKGPVVLVSHGPPQGKGKTALDWITDKKNVGDPQLNALIDKKTIPFGLFGHILEAGGSGVAKDLVTVVKPGKASPQLYVNAGSASGDPWSLNDGSTSYGMAMLFIIEGDKARYELKRFSARAEE